MPTTANNETLERIKKNAWSQYPMIAMKARRSAYEDGAIYRGVSFNKKDKIWQACIYTNGVNRYLGRGSETKCRDLYISALEAFEKQSEKK